MDYSFGFITNTSTTLDTSKEILAKQAPSMENTFIIAGKDKLTSSYMIQSYRFNSTSNTLILLQTAYLDLYETSSKISKIQSLGISKNSVFIGLEFENESFTTQILNLQNLTYVVANLTNEQKKAPDFLNGQNNMEKLIEVVNDTVYLYDLCEDENCLSCFDKHSCDFCRPDWINGRYTVDNFCYKLTAEGIFFINFFFIKFSIFPI